MAPDREGYGLVRGAAVVVREGLVAWIGSEADLPSEFGAMSRMALGGRLVTPGLIDCHTHIVHGGSRAREFEMRLEGASYEEVARAGGGIVSTVAATRETGESELLAQALERADALIAEGVTAIEVKSGYGLDIETGMQDAARGPCDRAFPPGACGDELSWCPCCSEGVGR